MFGAFETLVENAAGRDFVVGDIHGMFHLLDRALEDAGFTPEIDRVISVGDMINRGPQSARVMEFLDQPWFHAVRGNHEDKVIRVINKDGSLNRKGAFSIKGCGMSWLKKLSDGERLNIRNRLKSLPVAMETTTAQGMTIGFVHADIPAGMTWSDFRFNMMIEDESVVAHAQWARDKIENKDDQVIKGIDRIFLGHTVRKEVKKLGNCFYIETGAGKGYAKNKLGKYHLTLAQIDAPEDVLLSARQNRASAHRALKKPQRRQQKTVQRLGVTLAF